MGHVQPKVKVFLEKYLVLSTGSVADTLHFVPLPTRMALALPILELKPLFFLQMMIGNKFWFLALALDIIRFCFEQEQVRSLQDHTRVLRDSVGSDNIFNSPSS